VEDAASGGSGAAAAANRRRRIPVTQKWSKSAIRQAIRAGNPCGDPGGRSRLA